MITNHVFDPGLKLNSQNIFIWLRINNIWSKTQNQFSLNPSNILLDQAFLYPMLGYKNPFSQNFVHFFQSLLRSSFRMFSNNLEGGLKFCNRVTARCSSTRFSVFLLDLPPIDQKLRNS